MIPHPPASNRFHSIVVGIDASRNRSGGAVAHLQGLLNAADPRIVGIKEVHLWAYDQLLDAIKIKPWLIKHRVAATRSSLPGQLFWQHFLLPRLAKKFKVQVMFNTDAGSVCPYQPSVTLSQDMLSFEPGEMQRFPFPSFARLRLEVLRNVQLRRLEKSSKALFLSNHAQRVIGQLVRLPAPVVVPHGIDSKFFSARALRRPFPTDGIIRCLYVSNAAPYKHQWHVVAAISQLRNVTSRDLQLRLVGGGAGAAMKRLLDTVKEYDPNGQFVQLERFIPNDLIIDELTNADVFIYASSCENLPITILEAMAAGVPIASSSRGPMPEILGDAAVFFDPENPGTIADAVMEIISDSNVRQRIASKGQQIASNFTWQRCAGLTWQVLIKVAHEKSF